MEGEWAQYVRENWKQSTQTTQGSFVRKHIRPFFDDMLLSKIKPVTIAAFHAKKEAEGLGKKTRRTLHAILRTAFAYAVDTLELIDSNPVKKRLAPKLDEHQEKPALSEEQVLKLFDVLPERTKAFYMVLALTGIRTGEALGLKWADVDFASHELAIRRAIWRGRETTPKTGISLRARPIMPKLYRALLNHKAMAHYTTPSDYVFTSSTGHPMNPDQLREGLKAALREIGITFPARADGLHLLRHSSGSMVYRQTGGDVKATQQWLGHSNSRITLDTYTHLGAGQEQKTAERLEQAVFAPAKTPDAVH